MVGLLTGPDGLPVAVRVFQGNTNDTKTVSEQVRIPAKSFGVKEVTLVGDRGMLKGPQIEAWPEDFRYITAITKPQIVKLLNESTLQMELFSERGCEVTVDDIRDVLRRNPFRAEQVAHTRERAKIESLKATWLNAEETNRTISIVQDDAALADTAMLDGCYVIKSDVPKSCADAQTLHDRYCDLENVERAFRTMKTAHLDLRPVFVHKASSTQGHVFVVILALLVQRELEMYWSDLNLTVEEGLDELGAIAVLSVQLGTSVVNMIPAPNPRAAMLLEKASISLPSALSLPNVRVRT